MIFSCSLMWKLIQSCVSFWGRESAFPSEKKWGRVVQVTSGPVVWSLCLCTDRGLSGSFLWYMAPAGRHCGVPVGLDTAVLRLCFFSLVVWVRQRRGKGL